MRRIARIGLPALLEWAGLTVLLGIQPLEHHLVECIAVLMGTFAVYLISVGLILKESQSKPLGRNALLWIVVSGLGMRLMVFGLPPALTDDVLRYRWEARLQASGGNPYEVAPVDGRYAELRDETYGRISGKEFRAVYGPATELAYWGFYEGLRKWGLGAREEVFWLKGVAALAELGVAAGIVFLLKGRGLGVERVVWWWWCPAPVVEFWGNGHNDALMLCALVWGWGMVERGKWKGAFALVGLAGAAKLWPLGLTPLVMRRAGKEWKWVGLSVAVMGLCLAPYGAGLVRNGPFVSGFLGGWRNNDSLFGVLLWMFGEGYGAKYAAFGVLGVVILVVAWRRWAPVVVIGTMLGVAANVHPWYLTWLLVWMPVRPVLGVLTLAGLSPLFYAVLIGWEVLGEWQGVTPLRWMVYGPAVGVGIYEVGKWWVGDQRAGGDL